MSSRKRNNNRPDWIQSNRPKADQPKDRKVRDRNRRDRSKASRNYRPGRLI